MDQAKNPTLEKILDVARQEFMKSDYQNASLREIVKKAGLTTGAFYGYFKNKEQLFDALVSTEYEEMIQMYQDKLDMFFDFSPEDQYENMVSVTFDCMKRLKDYMYDHYDAVKLILCHSDGTKYKDFVHRMAAMDVEATHDFAKTIETVSSESKRVNPVLEHILTSGMFTGFFELIVHDVPKEEADEYMKQLLDFYAAGWGKIMGF